jgi:GT2 family glycosyltransferase
MLPDCREKLISVVIPTLNRCEFLPRCIASVFKQGYANLEVLIVDVVFGDFRVVEHPCGKHLYDFFYNKEVLRGSPWERIDVDGKMLKNDLFKARI